MGGRKCQESLIPYVKRRKEGPGWEKTAKRLPCCPPHLGIGLGNAERIVAGMPLSVSPPSSSRVSPVASMPSGRLSPGKGALRCDVGQRGLAWEEEGHAPSSLTKHECSAVLGTQKVLIVSTS